MIASLIGYSPTGAEVQKTAFVFEQAPAPVMRISETFDSRFIMMDREVSQVALFDSRLGRPDLHVTMELKDMALKDAYDLVSREVGIPIFTIGLIEGKADISVRDFPLERVLEMLTLPYGYDFIWLEDHILIGDVSSGISAYSQINYTMVFKPRYVSAEDLSSVLSDAYAPYITAYDDFLMVTAPFSILARIQQDITILDVPRKQMTLDVLALKISSEMLSGFDIKLFGNYLTDYSLEAAEERLGYPPFDTAKTYVDFGKSVEEGSSVPIYALARTRVIVEEGIESRIQLLWKFLDSNTGDALDEEEKNLMTLVFTGETVEDDDIAFKISISPSFTVQSRDIVVKNGESVVFVSAPQKEEIPRTGYIPILKDLPVLGDLFQWEYYEHLDMEMVIIVTPTIL